MIWNQASYRQRTFKTRVYKPVEPVGKKLAYLNQTGDDEHRWLYAEGNVMDAISCAGGCGYHICSKTGPCKPKPALITKERPLHEKVDLGRDMNNSVLRARAESVYLELCAEMRRVAPKSWFFQVPTEDALNCIAACIMVHGDKFRDPSVKAELAGALKLLVPQSRGGCTACGERGTQLAGRVCADMQGCDTRMQMKQASSSFCAPRFSGA
jgi:hypothetical protein